MKTMHLLHRISNIVVLATSLPKQYQGCLDFVIRLVKMYPMDYDEPQFLEPAHSHDPVQVSDLIVTPTSVTENIPSSFQEALTVLQESTSVAFASSKRLQALAADRLHRLVPAMGELSSSPVSEAGDIKCTAS